MYSATTHNVTVSVESTYEPSYSSVDKGHYAFSYEITIINHSRHTIKLLSREWYIKSLGQDEYVQGEGVVGQQPTLQPSMTFVYQSWVPLKSSIGKMYGYYTFLDLKSGEELKVEIPSFVLSADYINN